MEGFDARRVAKVVSLPPTCAVPVVIALGHTADEERGTERNDDSTLPSEHAVECTPRFAANEQVFCSSYGTPFDADGGGLGT